MSIRFNHTIVHSRNKMKSATFLADILGLPAPSPFGPFLVVELEDGATLDFEDVNEGEIAPQHYAFLIAEKDFDAIFARTASAGSTTGRTPSRCFAARSTTTTAGGASTSTIPTTISSRSSRVPTSSRVRMEAADSPIG